VEEEVPSASDPRAGGEGEIQTALLLRATNRLYELYAYDLSSNSLRQATRARFGTISPDGRDLYYLDDKQGNEIGHIVRIPFDETRKRP
jgi:Tol biopolymer transport system component